LADARMCITSFRKQRAESHVGAGLGLAGYMPQARRRRTTRNGPGVALPRGMPPACPVTGVQSRAAVTVPASCREPQVVRTGREWRVDVKGSLGGRSVSGSVRQKKIEEPSPGRGRTRSEPADAVAIASPGQSGARTRQRSEYTNHRCSVRAANSDEAVSRLGVNTGPAHNSGTLRRTHVIAAPARGVIACLKTVASSSRHGSGTPAGMALVSDLSCQIQARRVPRPERLQGLGQAPTPALHLSDGTYQASGTRSSAGRCPTRNSEVASPRCLGRWRVGHVSALYYAVRRGRRSLEVARSHARSAYSRQGGVRGIRRT